MSSMIRSVEFQGRDFRVTGLQGQPLTYDIPSVTSGSASLTGLLKELDDPLDAFRWQQVLSDERRRDRLAVFGERLLAHLGRDSLYELI